ncbi:reverse transcriptase domain, Reverse transcriptase zinc-binding domain protein [Artemisia annua]|uniref:Reverse transcriptase domain, Reverse transcriptase zinc-binding domain protein n=1 Tax=Artemisia annua TaxID=35608 RepID=A0A2U1Q7G6_ARTAN|nr:reverse transcriptase domain, Reverse transcriptase zinc-binding domain protein [Artemisia annua]
MTEAAHTLFDNWDDRCPLMSYLTPRVVTSAVFNLQENVVDIVSNGAWSWPNAWLNLYLILNQAHVPLLNNETEDTMFWKTRNGVLREFSVRDAWNTIRDRGEKVDWCHLVWSKYGIPRHATHLWLVMRNRLKTQDRLKQWDVGGDVDLSLL